MSEYSERDVLALCLQLLISQLQQLNVWKREFNYILHTEYFSQWMSLHGQKHFLGAEGEQKKKVIKTKKWSDWTILRLKLYILTKKEVR